MSRTNFTLADDWSEILAWLSPLELRLRHQDVRSNRVDNLGGWLLQTEQFRRWSDDTHQDESDKAALFCYGDPGVRKTCISSLVIGALGDRASGQDIAVTCLYFDFAAQKEQSPTSMLGALLKQLVSGLEEILGQVAQAFGYPKKVIGGRGLRLPEIVAMLQAISSSSRCTFIYKDALDECVPKYRPKLLGSLRVILQKSPATRLFMTGRAYIRTEVQKHLDGDVAIVSISPSKDDIVGYVRVRLDEGTAPDEMEGSLYADIMRTIPETFSEIFLPVSLNMDSILRETTIHRRRQRLGAVTHGVGLQYVYGVALDRIKAQGVEKSRLGLAALMWISHSQRPLQVDELCHALAAEIGSSNLSAKFFPSVGTLLGFCQGLIVVDKESSTVRLIHSTLQEYLSTHPDLLLRDHWTIAETCLTCLNSQQVNALSGNHIADLGDTLFLEYSFKYWETHAKMEPPDHATSPAMEGCDINQRDTRGLPHSCGLPGRCMRKR